MTEENETRDSSRGISQQDKSNSRRSKPEMKREEFAEYFFHHCGGLMRIAAVAWAVGE